MTLKLFNTLTRKLEVFKPLKPKFVRMYTCGLTVYDRMHLGHCRTYCFWDVVRRWLTKSGFHVMAVINYTDIDDRIISRSQERNVSIRELTEENISAFRLDCSRLHIQPYSIYVRATDYVTEMVLLIKKLFENGYAYVVDNGDVYYEVGKFSSYGKLSGHKVEDLIAGERVEVSDFKRAPADFVLWKARSNEPDDSIWDQSRMELDSLPWKGFVPGRPGWHIECSTMSTMMLGEHFDLHGGAIDNLFPHHENEIAQSEGAYGGCFCKYWMHPEHLIVEGEKMSKSLGNFITVQSALNDHDFRVIRLAFLQNHYKSPMNYTAQSIAGVASGWARINNFHDILANNLKKQQKTIREIIPFSYSFSGAFVDCVNKFSSQFADAMDNDFGTPQAVAALFDFITDCNRNGIESTTEIESVALVYKTLTDHLFLLGLELVDADLYSELAIECINLPFDSKKDDSDFNAEVDTLIQQRQQARADKNWAESDRIRDLIKSLNVVVEDTPQGPRWKKI